jgi:hypothetical protein
MIKNDHYIKATLLYLVILLLSTEICAFEKIKNISSRNIYFTGRALYLTEMRKKLSRYSIVYLIGYGGVGKSQLAKEYAYINEQKYDLIWWFDLKNDLEIQYENLLTHLSNNKKFKRLLHINVENIAPNVLVDFTNSLLSSYDGKWLLIFDNVNNRECKLPKTKSEGQHIIVTTRKKPFVGKNVLTLGPFTNQESELFLSKVHPKEKKEEFSRLYRALYNYPLALAQISEEILMRKEGIASFLKKHSVFGSKPGAMYPDITQEYARGYHEILNFTLQDIEQKDKKAAKVLYMLAVLNTDITKEVLKKIFGDDTEEEIMVLSNYGVIKITAYDEDSQVLNIHDVIREAAVKRFNSKSEAYKKEVFHALIKCFNVFYVEKNFQYLNGLDAANNHAAVLYAFIDTVLQNNIINEEVLDIVIISLKLNNILFSRYANYGLYQQLASKIYSKNLGDIAPVKKALLYANLIFSDLILESKESISKFEKEMLRLLVLIKSHKSHGEMFFIYTHMSQFYLFLGDLQESKKYAEEAQKNIHHAGSFFSLLQYWYTNAWLSYELRDIDAGVKVLESYVELNNHFLVSELGKLFLRNLKIKFEILIGRRKKAKKELEEAIRETVTYYNKAPSDILGELEFTKALLYFNEGQYDLAKRQCSRASSTLNKVFGGDMIDLTQAHIHIILGKIYEEKGNYNFAIEEYKRVLEFYNKISHGRAIGLYEHGELLANLCFIYYKLKNFAESKVYYQRLVSIFGLEHDVVEKLIKKLPSKYMYQIGGNYGK